MANFLFVVIAWTAAAVYCKIIDESEFANGFYIGSAFMFTIFALLDSMDGKK